MRAVRRSLPDRRHHPRQGRRRPGDLLAKLPFTLTYQVIRDVIAAGIYVVFLGGQMYLWSMWQARGKTKPAELPVSSYGRPLVKKA
jgi:hypothetical protein